MAKKKKKSKKIKSKKRKRIIKSKKKKKNKLKKIKKNDGPKEVIYKVKTDWAKKAIVNKSEYEKKYKQSLKDNEGFWKKEGRRISWIKPYSKIKDVKYSKSDVHIKWFYDGTLNASSNCIDRHLKKNKDKTAIIWVGDDPKIQKKYHTNNYTKKFLKQLMVLKNWESRKGTGLQFI